MSSDPRLAALPAIRKLAGEQAHEHYEAWSAARKADSRHQSERWEFAHAGRRVGTAARLALLSDLSRPASRDAVARLVAEALGADVSEGAILRRSWRGYWEVWARWTAENGSVSFRVINLLPWDDVKDADPRNSELWNRPAAYLDGITDPIEALTLIALSVLA